MKELTNEDIENLKPGDEIMGYSESCRGLHTYVYQGTACVKTGNKPMDPVRHLLLEANQRRASAVDLTPNKNAPIQWFTGDWDGDVMDRLDLEVLQRAKARIEDKIKFIKENQNDSSSV